MKVLFLTPQVPYPPQKGTELRNWGLMSGLAARHEVAALSFLPPAQSLRLGLEQAWESAKSVRCREPRPERRRRVVEGPVEGGGACRMEVVEPPVRTLRDRLRGMLTTRQPDMALRLASEVYAQRLAERLRRDSFDVVQVEGIELGRYLEIARAARPRPLVVFDDHNCEYVLQRRTFLTDLRAPARWLGAAYSFLQWRRLRRYEARVCGRADRVVAVSEADAAALRRLVPGLEVTVVPNGIDTGHYRPERVGCDGETSGTGVAFTGTMDFRPNVDAVIWFVKRVLPRIRAEVPEVSFLVVGQRPHRRLDRLRDDPAVTVTGWVEDVRPYIAEATVYVAPLRTGGGTRLKLLEAMAMGKPVVATRLGAEGYPVTDGHELLLADTPGEFAAAVVALLRSPGRRAKLGEAAQAFVEQGYDWSVIVPRMEAVYGP